MQREITRETVREVVRRGLQEARGNYKIVARMFNMDQGDYKRFLNFLRRHNCEVPFQRFRTVKAHQPHSSRDEPGESRHGDHNGA
jgi:hypothetical protein